MFIVHDLAVNMFHCCLFSEFIDDTEGFGTDHVSIEQPDYSYALGKEGATRKKLAKASGAILEYVGRIAFISGKFHSRQHNDRKESFLQTKLKHNFNPKL